MPTLNRPPIFKVGIIDDHLLFRKAIAGLVEGEFQGGKFMVIIEAENGMDFMTKLNSTEIPDIVFLDINMPVMDGYETMEWIISNQPHIKVIILTMFDDLKIIKRMVQMGVRGYLTKNAAPDEIRSSIIAVINNGFYFSAEVARKLFEVLATKYDEMEPDIELSKRELEFLRLMASENSYLEIARIMFISPRTVDNFRDRLFAKLNVRSRLGLSLYAIRNGIVKP